MDFKDREVPLSELRRICDPAQFPFQTTAELLHDEEVIGQDRAVKAIEFGLSIKNQGYNIFVSGVPGTGRNSVVKSIIRRISRDLPVPDDWCYLNNFKDNDHPRAISLPAGKGREFRSDMERFITFLQNELAKVFASKEYEEQKSQILEGTEKAKEALFNDASKRAQELGFQLSLRRTGIAKIPSMKGKQLSQEEIEALTAEQKFAMDEHEKTVDSDIRDFLAKARQLEKEAHEKLRDLNRKVAHFAMGHQLDELREKYRQNPRIPEYLAEVEEDILANLSEFLGQTQETPFVIEGLDRGNFHERYKVNLIVDNADTRGGPIVDEANPTYSNLLGRIERKAKFGALYTNFMMIRPGSVLQANGGYLVLNCLDVLRNPFAWEALKRVIKKSEVRIEDVAELYGFGSGGIKPEPIPVSVKIIVLGSPFLYYLLYNHDEDFRQLFKIRSDFDTRTQDTAAEATHYANFIANRAKQEGLLPFDRTAVAGIMEHASRLAERKDKLSLRFSEISDLVRESSYWAAKSKAPVVIGEHVERALAEKVFRESLVDERVQEMIRDGTLMIAVSGKAEAQVNALSVYEVGDFLFGKPSRITCRVSLGKAGVIDIEREAKLSGRIYNKAVLILSGYLAGTYAQDKTLSLSASIAFEQSYGEMEGDSATIAELAALLSGIAGLPLAQNLAITGSINQKGEIQPIGGVNEKIEGFFAVCRNKGLSGDQGVIIPLQNVKNLMLRKEVVDAVREGKFRIYAVSTADQALEILTDMPAGERKADNTWPEGTINFLVDRKLREMAKKLKREDGSEEKKERKEENNQPAKKDATPLP